MSDSYWFNSNGQIQDYFYPKSAGFTRCEAAVLIGFMVLVILALAVAAIWLLM